MILKIEVPEEFIARAADVADEFGWTPLILEAGEKYVQNPETREEFIRKAIQRTVAEAWGQCRGGIEQRLAHRQVLKDEDPQVTIEA